MLFNSFQFLLFLPITFLVYWLIGAKRYKAQNILFLLIFSTLLDYFTGLKMENANSERSRRVWFWISVVVNLGFLGVFKYFNFFVESFANAFSRLGNYKFTDAIKEINRKLADFGMPGVIYMYETPVLDSVTTNHTML